MAGVEGRWVGLGRWMFATLFVSAGVSHFVVPDLFVRAMPPYIPWHRPMVLISGGIEILLGVLLLVPRTRRLAAWGLVALLVAVFPANVHIYLHQDLFPAPPAYAGWMPYAHLLRLPLQAVLIAWAYAYTRRRRSEPVPAA